MVKFVSWYVSSIGWSVSWYISYRWSGMIYNLTSYTRIHIPTLVLIALFLTTFCAKPRHVANHIYKTEPDHLVNMIHHGHQKQWSVTGQIINYEHMKIGSVILHITLTVDCTFSYIVVEGVTWVEKTRPLRGSTGVLLKTQIWLYKVTDIQQHKNWDDWNPCIV